MSEVKLSKLRDELKEVTTNLAIAESKQKDLLKKLSTYGIKTIKQAEKREKELLTKIDEMKAKMDSLIEKAEKRLKEYEDE